MGFSTLVGRPRGFFIPYRHAASVTLIDYPAIERLLGAARPELLAVLAAIEDLALALRALGGPPPAPRFEQSWFPRLDGAAAYALVRTRKPARIVEVGSGHSTRFLARAIADGALATELICIDPAPRAALDRLDVTWQPTLLQAAPHALFEALGPGDLLLVDSSHVLMPGSDVDWLLGRILPGLAAGVLVHFHDVFLPDAYPPAWSWRGYNEQQALLPLLTSGAYGIVFASHFVTTRLADQLAAGVVGGLPCPADAHESSLWLEKRTDPV